MAGTPELDDPDVASGAMRFGLLGPLEVTTTDGQRVDVGGPQPRLVLAVLLMAGGHPVRADSVIDAVWGETPPASAAGTLQSYVSRLRRVFEGASDGAVTLDYADGSYRLAVDADHVDAWRFEVLADEGHALLTSGDPAAARDALVVADALWRGPVLPELADHEGARSLAVRLAERRVAALEDRIDADLALGRHGALVGELTSLVEAHPLRERLRGQLALAMYRAGRQADALRALADAGRTLRDELGIEPSRELRDLETAILDHDPRLDLAPAAPVGPTSATSSAGDAPGGTGTASGGPARFVGRDAELRQLRAALEEAAEDSRFVVIEGDPGIGKTRLADELRAVAEAAGSTVLWGRTDEGGAAPALWPWLAPLRALVDAQGGDDRVRDLLAGELEVLPGVGPAVQFELFEAVAHRLERPGGGAPIVVLIDDLQWADEVSLELLSFLAGRLGPGALVVATTRRLEVGHRGQATDALAAIARRRGSRRLQLRGLRADATAAMLDDLDAAVAESIHQRAEGNPFYAIELGRLVDEGGRLPDDVPSSVSDVVRRRLADLPDPTLDLLGVAAVVGREVDLALLARSTGADLATTLDTIEPAVVQRLLVDDPDRVGTLRFSHALVRDVLLQGLTSLRRARLHLAVADAMEERGIGRDEAEILAEHLWQAAPVGVGRRAAEALEQAAEVAATRVAYAAAEDLLDRALRLRHALGSGEAERRAELATSIRYLEITQITRYFQGADNDKVGRALELALELGEVETHRRVAWYQWAAGATAARVVESGPLAAAYLERYRDDERPMVRSSAYEVYGVWLWGSGRVGEAARTLDRAVELLDGVPPPDDLFMAEQYLVTFTFWLYNNLIHGALTVPEAMDLYQQLHDGIPDPVGRASACGFAMTTFAPLLEWEAVDHFGRLAVAADPRSQYGFWGGQLQMHLGLLAAWKGRIDDALGLFASGRARYNGIGGYSGMHSFESSMAILLAQQGHLEPARTAAAAARGHVDHSGERWAEVSVFMAEAWVAHGDGDDVAAAERLQGALAVAAAQEAHGFVPTIVATADELGVELDLS